MRKTIAIDFDGVIHAYRHGYQDGTLYDEPMEGAGDAVKELLKTHCVYVHSTRYPHMIKDWFAKHFPEIITYVIELDNDMRFWDQENILGISARKIPAIAYIDDRGLRFTNWRDMLNHF